MDECREIMQGLWRIVRKNRVQGSSCYLICSLENQYTTEDIVSSIAYIFKLLMHSHEACVRMCERHTRSMPDYFVMLNIESKAVPCFFMYVRLVRIIAGLTSSAYELCFTLAMYLYSLLDMAPYLFLNLCSRT